MNHLLKLAIGAIIAAAPLGATAFADPAAPGAPAAPANNRLVIVNGNTDQVIYDDGRDDMFCVTRVHRWYDDNGRRHRRRTMHCR